MLRWERLVAGIINTKLGERRLSWLITCRQKHYSGQLALTTFQRC